MGGEHSFLTPDDTCTSHIEGGLVFGGRSLVSGTVLLDRVSAVHVVTIPLMNR
jgi:hypothetical protein